MGSACSRTTTKLRSKFTRNTTIQTIPRPEEVHDAHSPQQLDDRPAPATPDAASAIPLDPLSSKVVDDDGTDICIDYTPVGPAKAKYKYYCPLCMMYFRGTILEVSCCKNYICYDCALDFLRGKHGLSTTLATIPASLPAQVPCPHCSLLGVGMAYVKPEAATRSYMDSPATQQRLEVAARNRVQKQLFAESGPTAPLLKTPQQPRSTRANLPGSMATPGASLNLPPTAPRTTGPPEIDGIRSTTDVGGLQSRTLAFPPPDSTKKVDAGSEVCADEEERKLSAEEDDEERKVDMATEDVEEHKRGYLSSGDEERKVNVATEDIEEHKRGASPVDDDEERKVNVAVGQCGGGDNHDSAQGEKNVGMDENAPIEDRGNRNSGKEPELTPRLPPVVV